MKQLTSNFGLMSGISTALGLTPHIVSLLLFVTIGFPSRSLTFLIIFTIGAKFLGEWIFWNWCKIRIPNLDKIQNWRELISLPFLSHNNVRISLLTIGADLLIDSALIFGALKITLPVFWIFLVLLIC